MKSLQLQVLRSFYRGDNESTILLKVDFFDEDDYLIHYDELDSERTLNARVSNNFTNNTQLTPKGSSQIRGIKILLPKQMFQRLQILLAQVQASSTPESLLNKIQRIVYSLHRPK